MMAVTFTPAFPFYTVNTPDIFSMQKYVNTKDESLVYGYIRVNASALQHDKLIFNINCIPEINLTVLWYYLLLSTFEGLNLKQTVVAGLHKAGYHRPSAMQQHVINSIIQKKDIIVQSKRRTGKTGAYLIASLQMVDLTEPQCQILIMVPTRDQISKIYRLSDIMCSQISKGTQIVVGTVNNIQYMLEKNVLSLQKLKLLVLDNVNQMIERHITSDIHKCVKYLPHNVQIALITVRMSYEIIRLTEELMVNPERILMTNNTHSNHIALHSIHQYYVATEKDEEDKLETLYDILENLKITQAIIYCNTARKDKMEQNLQDFADSVSDNDTNQMIKELIVTSDISPNKCDIPLIINYDLPIDPENYTQRIGVRKYGRHGVAINFVDDASYRTMMHIEEFYNTMMHELPMELDDVNSLLLSDTIKTIEIN